MYTFLLPDIIFIYPELSINLNKHSGCIHSIRFLVFMPPFIECDSDSDPWNRQRKMLHDVVDVLVMLYVHNIPKQWIIFYLPSSNFSMKHLRQELAKHAFSFLCHGCPCNRILSYINYNFLQLQFSFFSGSLCSVFNFQFSNP